jgi:hypothetical protein
MVKSHANNVEFALTARMPKTQVRPRSGRRTSDPIKMNLGRMEINKQLISNGFITSESP